MSLSRIWPLPSALPVEAATVERSPSSSNVPSMRHGPASDLAEMVELISEIRWLRPPAAWRSAISPSVTVSFSIEIWLRSKGEDGRIAQSTVPLSAMSIVAFGCTSRMSKISTSPRRNGASSASIENVSTVIAGWPPGPPATVTLEKVTEGNGNSLAVASPCTVTLRPRMALASRSNSAR